MYSLNQGKTFLHLTEDLNLLEFGSGNVCFRAQAPFQLDWTGIPVTPDNMNRQVTATENEIHIDFSNLRFAARFPGNSYCRPAPEYTPDFRFSVTLALQDEDLIVRISPVENIGSCSLKLLVAGNFFTASTQARGSLVLPVDFGTRIDFPRIDVYSAVFQPSAAWSLPVHGFFRENGGIGLWCEEPDRDYAVSFNTDVSGTVSATCRLLYDAECNTSREMRFMLFHPGSDFRALARRCRQLRQASGRFRTLAEKAAEHPEVSRLPGTVFWKHNIYLAERPEGVEKTYSLYVARPGWNENEGLPNNWTAAEIFETAHAAGFDRVTACSTGWNHDGYDAGYPARLPVNPERGTEQDFKNAVDAAHRLSAGYTLSVHDNYIDAYEGNEYHEEEMLQIIRGVPHTASVWQGGQAHFMCSESGLKYARRDLPRIAELTGRGCIYLDVNAAVPLFHCRSAKHPLTRRQDEENRREIFRIAKQYFGAVAVEGCGTDHFADIIDIGAYGGLHFSGLSPRTPGAAAVPVPLWQMVYHDSVMNYFGEGYSPVHGSEYRLYQALYTLLPTAFDEHSKRISTELRSACSAPMVDFEELIPRTVFRRDDGSFRTHGVARSVFGDGTEVIANFNETEFICGGLRIPPREYHIRKITGIPETEKQLSKQETERTAL